MISLKSEQSSRTKKSINLCSLPFWVLWLSFEIPFSRNKNTTHYSRQNSFHKKINGNCNIESFLEEEKDYEIVENLGVLSETDKGWQKELNLVSWNERPAKYDLRDWSPNHEKMGKGITLSKSELAKLKEILADTEIK